ncbi:MAG: hypothetical protein ACOX2A_01465 [Tepidanaerobacteraceae bacterium]|jgi:hypothetical protein|nr:hypothetical protein [Thermoanaerobacterales bacterium]
MKKVGISILAIAMLAMIIPGTLSQAVEPSPGRLLEGYIKDIGDSFVEVEEYSGYVRRLALNVSTVYVIDDTPADPRDFKPGMEIYVRYNNTGVTYMESWSTENPGYIAPGLKIRSGVIKKIDRDQLIIRFATGKEEAYYTSPSTIAIKNGVNVPLSNLYEGDMVQLYFDEIDSAIISRIKIQGDSIKIKGLYKGQLDVSGIANNDLILKDVKIFQNGSWRDYKNTLQINHSPDLKVFYQGQPLSKNNMKLFRGKTVYLAVTDFFGRDRAERAVIKNQYETSISGKIEEVNWYAEAFELANKRNISFNDGTIFVKNNRLVDKYSISPGSDAFVVVDGRGSRIAADVVYIYDQGLNNSNIGQFYLYAGQLDMVVQSQVTLTDFFVLNRNEWESFDDEKELYYDDDTYIFDLEEMKQISSEQFYTDYYAVDEESRSSRRRGLKSWYAYAYTDGDRIVAIVLKKNMDSLLRQRVTAGTVDILEDDLFVGKTVLLRNARDWSNRNNMWMPRTLQVRMRMENALIIKGDKVISWEDLRAGDNIYSVRDDFECKFIIVK